MNFSDIVLVSKLPGLFLIHNKRTDGLIIKSLVDNKLSFASSRNHSFTPIDNITIYTNTDSISLPKVLELIYESSNKLVIPNQKSNGDDLKSFFETILPDYDKDKVYTSDILKIIKMYNVLVATNFFEDIKEKEKPKSSEKNNKIVNKDSKDKDDIVENVEVKKKSTNTKKTSKTK